MDQLWSYLLGAVGLLGFILAGRRVWWCWYVNIFCQVLWFTYGITTHQFGFVLSAVVYAVVFSNNARKWTNDRAREQQETQPDR